MADMTLGYQLAIAAAFGIGAVLGVMAQKRRESKKPTSDS
jgi:hypothetical protein